MNYLSEVEATAIAYLDSQLTGIRVKSYAGEFDTNASDRISFNAPALFVSFLGAQLTPCATGKLSADTKWAGFLVLHQAKKQTTKEKEYLTQVLSALNNSSLGLAAPDINLQSFEQILSRHLEKGNLIAWVIRWQHQLKLLVESKKWDGWDDE